MRIVAGKLKGQKLFLIQGEKNLTGLSGKREFNF
jgi:hypothetical protein